jgi:hypothetical protein
MWTQPITSRIGVHQITHAHLAPICDMPVAVLASMFLARNYYHVTARSAHFSVHRARRLQRRTNSQPPRLKQRQPTDGTKQPVAVPMDKRGSFGGTSSDDVEAPLLPPPARDDGAQELRSPPSWVRALIAHRYPAVAAGPAAAAAVCALVDLAVGGGAHAHHHREARNMLAVLAWVFLWWVTGAVPLAVASMAPLFLFPLFGVSSADAVAKAYMDDVISLVLGSFILALAIEHYQIHRRLALNVRAALPTIPCLIDGH